MAYGAGAVQLLKAGQTAVMVAFVPPDIRFLPLKDAVNQVRTVPADSEFLRIAQSLGIYLGTGLVFYRKALAGCYSRTTG